MVDICTRLHHGAMVVSLAGRGDAKTLEMVADGIAALADSRSVVVDMNELMLAKVAAVRGFLAHLLDPDPRGVSLVCARLSGRRLLRQWAGDDALIFATLEDALGRRLAPTLA